MIHLENESFKPTIKIGASLPLSGDTALFGKLTQDSINMALEKWKKRDTKYRYEVIYSDDMLKSSQAALNTNRFIDVHGVSAILSMWGTVDKVIDNIANKKQVITMSCTIGKGKMSPYAINNETPSEYYIDLLKKQLLKYNIQKIAIIVLNAKSNVTLGDDLYEALINSGIEITDYEKVNADTRDYRMIIAKMQKNNPDYYIMQMGVPGMDIFVKQFMEMNPQRNLTSIWNFAELSPENQPLVEGLWFIRGESGTKSFYNAFMAKTGQEPNSCAANSYDNMDVLIWAYENTPLQPGERIPNNKDVMQTLKNIKNWQGAVGTFNIDESGEVLNKPSLQVYKKGKFLKVEEQNDTSH